MNDPLLFDVPRNETKLDAWKRIHAVTTFEYSPDHLSGQQPWQALKGNVTEHEDYWIAESSGGGQTEEDACMTLARILGIAFTESITQQMLEPLKQDQ